MKPTYQQLLHATERFDSHGPAIRLKRLFDHLDGVDLVTIVSELTNFAAWTIPVRIAKFDMNCPLQIKLEPITDICNIAKALSWCINEQRPCDLVPYKGEDNLLVQALNQGYRIARYLPHPKDHRDKDGNLLTVLDPGSVLLAFELAGIPAPDDYQIWREPNEVDVYSRAEIPTIPSLGTVRVHFHNGMCALITSGDGKIARVVHCKHMKSTAVPELKGLIATNTKPKVATGKKAIEELKSEDIKNFMAAFSKKS